MSRFIQRPIRISGTKRLNASGNTLRNAEQPQGERAAQSREQTEAYAYARPECLETQTASPTRASRR